MDLLLSFSLIFVVFGISFCLTECCATPCPACQIGTIPDEMELTITGFGNNTCTDCETLFNTTFEPPYNGSTFICQWSMQITGCSLTWNLIFRFQRNSSTSKVTVEVSVISLGFGNVPQWILEEDTSYTWNAGTDPHNVPCDTFSYTGLNTIKSKDESVPTCADAGISIDIDQVPP